MSFNITNSLTIIIVIMLASALIYWLLRKNSDSIRPPIDSEVSQQLEEKENKKDEAPPNEDLLSFENKFYYKDISYQKEAFIVTHDLKAYIIITDKVLKFGVPININATGFENNVFRENNIISFNYSGSNININISNSTLTTSNISASTTLTSATTSGNNTYGFYYRMLFPSKNGELVVLNQDHAFVSRSERLNMYNDDPPQVIELNSGLAGADNSFIADPQTSVSVNGGIITFNHDNKTYSLDTNTNPKTFTKLNPNPIQ